MHQSLFFRLFPPPKYMAMSFAGLEISDDAIRCLQYKSTVHGQEISRYAEVDIPPGVIDGGDVKNDQILKDMMKSFVEKNGLSYVAVSVPEEKAYLFQTDVTGASVGDIAQNIEFKLEENVPLSARDAVFYFDLMPLAATGGILRASVSVVPKTYIEKQIDFLQSFGLSPVAFEVAPKSIARIALSNKPDKTSMVVHFMKNKTGIYIVAGGVVCFTSTVPNTANISQEINHTFEYWKSKTDARINEIVLTGTGALDYEAKQFGAISVEDCSVSVANTWNNAFDIDSYLPPMPKSESLEYIVVAGLALDS